MGKHDGHLEFGYDVGFALEPRISEEKLPDWIIKVKLDNKPLIGINISGLLYIGGYTHNNMFGLKADYRKIIHTLINYFVQEHEAYIMLVPHVLGVDKKSESDVVACQNVFRVAKSNIGMRLYHLEDQYDQHELKALIGKCDFFLGSRMHACIAALSQCVPSIGLAYSLKFKGVFASIGMEEMVIDLRAHDEKSVLEAVEGQYQRIPELQAQLTVEMKAVRASIYGLFNSIIK
jgi:polysaccharide pyruvyl transferase WcaK-like protein